VGTVQGEEGLGEAGECLCARTCVCTVHNTSAQGGAKQRGRVTGIAKLDDANDAGSRRASGACHSLCRLLTHCYAIECTLILTEGDSAKSLAQAGISVVGADTYMTSACRARMCVCVCCMTRCARRYGCFPLKGKLLNVRDASLKQLMDNEEINNIITILGLKKGQECVRTTLPCMRTRAHLPAHCIA
jgi:hypothetical protein